MSLVSDELWERIEPLIPERKRTTSKGGRPPVANRAALMGILFVLKTGIPWKCLPQEMGSGSGMTCWRRLRDWQAAGVWHRLHEALLAELHASDKIDWSRATVDSGTVRAVEGGEETGPNPTDRGKPGSKHHVITDANDVPLQVETTPASRHDIMQLLSLVVNIPPVKGKPGHPRSRPDGLYADGAYDCEGARELLRWLGIEQFIPKRNTEHGSGLGKRRWVSEQTISWLHNFRRLRTRFDRRIDIHNGLVAFAKCMTYLGILMQ